MQSRCGLQIFSTSKKAQDPLSVDVSKNKEP